MTRHQASQMLRDELNKYGLTDWSVRLNQNAESRFLGLCSYKDKCIILSAHHVDIHPTPDVENTIRHEVAHAIVGPGHAHDEVWSAKAREIGCDNTLPCSNLSLSPEVIDAIRSGATVEVTFEEHVIRTPKFNITRLQDKCEECGLVARTKDETFHQTPDDQPDIKVIELECGHFIIRTLPKGTPFHTFQAFGDPTCAHEWDKNNCLKCGRKRPYDYQIESMQFVEAALAVNNGCLVAHEMGLGKTNIAMGTIFFHMKQYKKVLWVLKSGLKHQFQQTMLDWMGFEHLAQIVQTSKDYLIPAYKHYIIAYDMLVPKVRTIKGKNGRPDKTVTSGFDISQFDRVGIDLVVLDECQQIKNVDSTRTQMVRRVVKGRKVIGLSGTPWKNRGSELFPILNMLDPMKFNSEAGFKRQWVDYYWSGNQPKEGGIKRIPQFREYTKDIIIRRERTEVMAELPLVNRTKLYVKMDEESEKIYDECVDEFVKWYESQLEQMTGMAIIAAMQKMRHLVGLAKIDATLEYIDEFVEDTDRKLVIFAHHKDVQGILFDKLTEKYGAEMPVLRLVSEMSGIDRYNAQVKFNESPRCLMVASTLAAGEGLNLQTCCDCIIHERQWNPANEEQAEGRFIRIGAVADTVNAIYTELQGLTTIDPQLDAINERKRIQYHNVMNNTEMPTWNQDAMMKELAEVIVRAHKAKRNQ